MSKDADNLVIEILRCIQTDMSDMKADMREMRSRIGFVERGQAQIEVKLAEISTRLDRRDETFERILRRLDLVEHPH